MQKQKEKTFKQVQAIFGLCNKNGIDDDMRRAEVFALTAERTNSVSQLTFAEANKLIVKLGGDGFPNNGIPRRTINHHKQAAGVVTMATPKHLAKMDDLAANRGMSPEGLERLCWRMIKAKRPRTAKACNAVIEALKSMIDRDQKRRAA